MALHRALARHVDEGLLPELPLSDSVAAVSVGVVDEAPRLDLPYAEDVRAEVDMNVVMAGDGRFVEVQGTAEGTPFSRGTWTSCSSSPRAASPTSTAAAAACAAGR